jgi:uncharacterized membrane protein
MTPPASPTDPHETPNSPPPALERPLVVTEAEAQPPRPASEAAEPEPVAATGGVALVSSQLDSLLGEVLAAKVPAAERRDVDAVVHRLLVVGLGLSSLLMVLGLVLDVVLHRQIPATIPDLGEMLARVLAGRPSGFLSLGLLVLLATPIVRVIGSIAAFVHERDWRYALVSSLVLLVVILSVVLGQG